MNPVFTLIDLSNVGITRTEERIQDIDQFNVHTQAVLNPEPETPVVPGTPVTKKPIEPENLTEPEQVIIETMAKTTQNTANGKGDNILTSQ